MPSLRLLMFGWAHLAVVIDCHDREIIGYELALRGRAKEAERALEDACLRRFGTLRPEGPTPVLRSDNGLIFQSRRFRAACRDYGISQEFITPYRRARLVKGASNATANRDVVALNAMLNWATRTGLIGFNPLGGIQKLPEGRAHQKAPRRPLSEAEAQVFIQAAVERDQLLAARSAASKTIRGGTKGAKYCERLRSPRILQAPLWLPKVNCLGQHVCIHSLRHTFASRLAGAGVGLLQAQKLLGHSDPKLTAEIYTHLAPEELRAAVEGLPEVRIDVIAGSG